MVAPFSFQSRWSGEKSAFQTALLTADSWIRSVRMAESNKAEKG
jgi:hypothetical protein